MLPAEEEPDCCEPEAVPDWAVPGCCEEPLVPAAEPEPCCCAVPERDPDEPEEPAAEPAVPAAPPAPPEPDEAEDPDEPAAAPPLEADPPDDMPPLEAPPAPPDGDETLPPEPPALPPPLLEPPPLLWAIAATLNDKVAAATVARNPYRICSLPEGNHVEVTPRPATTLHAGLVAPSGATASASLYPADAAPT